MNLPVKLDDKKILQQKEFANSLVKSLNDAEKHSLKLWCQDLLIVRNSSVNKIQKIKSIVEATGKRKVIFPVLKSIYKSVKKYAWQDRGVKSRFGIIGIGVGATFFAGQSAGIAALGSAIGVPLWVVFGAGGTFAGFIVEEAERNFNKKEAFIDVKYQDITLDESGKNND